MRRVYLLRLQTLIVISLVWMIFGFVFFYNVIHVRNDLGVRISLLRFVIIFAFIGFIISWMLVFLKNAFNRFPMWLSIFIKMIITFVLFIVLSFLVLTIYYVFVYKGNFESFAESFFTKIMLTDTFAVFMGDMLLMTLLSIILLEITDKYGPGMFWSMLSGQYHNPKVEDRIFIFLDINSATTIAEQLGHTKYFRMLRDFFNDITIPVIANGGLIYQYVGDEVVLSWSNTPENKIRALKFIRNSYYLIKRKEKLYKRRYKHAPEFKVGLHAGEVTAGFIGLIKRDLVYSGDTVNTTARIRSMCNDLNESFVLSEDFMHDFHQPHGYEIKEIGKIELKGREEPVKVFSLKFE